jgi:heptosyltransferase-2
VAALAPSPVAVLPPAGVAPADPGPDGPILLRVPNWLGDAVLALPAVSALCEAFRERPVVVVARRGIAPLFVGQDGITDVILVPGRGLDRLSTMRQALSEKPALAVVLPDSVSAAAEVAVTRPRSAWGYGGVLRGLALDVLLPRRWARGRHRWEKYALLAAAVAGRPVVERYPIRAAPGDVVAAAALFAEAGLDGAGAPIVGLVPGAHASSRRWPAERFAELASALGREGARVVLLGAAGDSPITSAIAGLAEPSPADWAGRTTLPELAECFRRLDLVVTNDTGPMHLAAAVGTPLADLCGAADERETGPRGAASEVLVHPIHCRPCVKNTCAYNLGCMTGIPVSAVLERVRARLLAEA